MPSPLQTPDVLRQLIVFASFLPSNTSTYGNSDLGKYEIVKMKRIPEHSTGLALKRSRSLGKDRKTLVAEFGRCRGGYPPNPLEKNASKFANFF